MWRNETECGIHVTRFIMSWVRVGGTFSCVGDGYDDFREWLNTLMIDGEPLSDQDVNHIMDLAVNGKMELEYSATKFLTQKK